MRPLIRTHNSPSPYSNLRKDNYLETWVTETLKQFSFDHSRYLRAASHLQSFFSSQTVSHPQSTLTQGVNKAASVHQGNLVCAEGSVRAGQHRSTPEIL